MRHKHLYLFVLLALVLGLFPAGAIFAGPQAAGPALPVNVSNHAAQPVPITIPLGTNTITLDSFCNVDLEYNDAVSFTYTDYNGTGIVYLKHTGTDLYVCIQGTNGTLRDRFFRVYLDRDHAQEAVAQADDLGLQVSLATNAPSVVKGTGSGNYAPGVAFGWAVASSIGNQDAAEYRIPIRLTNGWCGDAFGLAIYHHWVTAGGDDYGWPSNQWYDQPQTWQQVVLASAPCQIPVYRLAPPTVNPGTAMGLASLLDGLGGQEAVSDTTGAGTLRFNVVNQVREAALQQLGASAGFFAFNANEAFTPKARGPFDTTMVKQLACNFLMVNELFPWDQTPSDATNCDQPAALPYEINIINQAGQTSGNGPNQVLTPTQSAVIVHVPLGINIGDAAAPNFIPLTGPGGHLSLLFTTSDPTSTAWSLDSSVPGLAALAEPWHDRMLDPPSQHILIGLNQALQQLQSQFPGQPIDPGEPELAYFVGDPAVPQTLLMPVWTFPDASVQDGGQTIFLRTPMVPAAPDVVPSVAITNPPSGSTFMPGQPVTLDGTIGGGTGPYTFTWSSEGGTVLGTGVSGGGAVNLTTSAIPALARYGIPISTTVHLDAVDSMGASAGDQIWLRPAYAPLVFLPIIVRNTAMGLAAAAPDASVQAIYRTGVEWITQYNGLNPNLSGTQPDGNGFYDSLIGYGWGYGPKWTNNSAWEKDWRDCSLGGIDCSLGMDRAEFAYFSGHGSPARIYFGTTKDSSSFWGGNARFQTIKWAGFSSCQTLSNSTVGDWFNAFQGGARVLLGFQSNMGDVAFGTPLVDNMRMPTFWFIGDLPWLQRTIPQAWEQTAFQMNAGMPAYLYVTGHGVDTSLDKLPRNGDPALANPYPIEWYFWVWWE